MSKYVALVNARRSPSRIVGRDDINIRCVMSESPTRTVKTATHPVEEGVDITDHAVLEPDKLKLSVILASTDDLARLYQVAEDRQFIDVVGGLMVYNNMLLKDITPTRTSDDGDIISCELGFEQVIVVRSTFVRLPEEQQRSAGRQPSGKAKTDEMAAAIAVGTDAAAYAANAEAAQNEEGSAQPSQPPENPNGKSLAKTYKDAYGLEF